MVNELKAYAEKLLKQYDKEELIEILAILMADGFSREYSYIHNGATHDNELYLGMDALLIGHNAKNIEYAKIRKDYVDYLADIIIERQSKNKGNLN